MADTDTDTDTDTDGATDTLLTMGTMTTSPSTTNGSTMSGTTNTTTNPSSTTMEPGTSTTKGETSSTTMAVDETGECPPGTEDCPCDIGSMCEGELMCFDGMCVAEVPCKQPETEPNDSLDEAIDLGEIPCDPDFMMGEGALAGLDADFYTLVEGEGGAIGCFDPDPQATVEADMDVRVCVFMACDDGTGDVNCGGEQDDETYEELNGCCGTNEARLFGAGCPGFPAAPDPVFYLRITSAEDNMCLPYTLSYRMD